MAWIESHDTLARHPKTLRAARLAGVAVPQIIGHLHLLWWFALDYAGDGDLSAYEAADLEDAMMWSGEGGALVAALCNAGVRGAPGFLEAVTRSSASRDNAEPYYLIHDWHHYAGRLIEKREANAERNRQYRANKAKKQPPEQGKRARDTAERTASASRDAQRAAARRATRPNQTLQNQELREPNVDVSPPSREACGYVDNSEEKPEPRKTEEQGKSGGAATERFAVDVVRCGARHDVAAIAGVAEAGNLYNTASDLGATAARLGAYLADAARDMLPEADEAAQLEAARTMMRSALRRARAANESQPIDNLAAYLTAMRKKATHPGDVAGDDVVEQVRAAARNAGGGDAKPARPRKSKPTKLGDVIAGMREGAATL